MNYNGIEKVQLYQLCKGKGEYGIGASSVPKSDDLPTYLRITDISDNGDLIIEGLTSVDHRDSSKYYLKENDIVFARTGASTGRAFFYEKKYGELVYAGFLIKFSLNEKKVNPKYLKYFCLSEQYKGWVKAYTGGSTRGNINAKTFGDMIIELPNRKQQDYLVKVLSSLNDKIELNNKINKNLEKLAQSLFKQWFLDFEFLNDNGDPYKSYAGEMAESELGQIPKGWSIKNLLNIADYMNGIAVKKFVAKEDEKSLPVLKIKELGYGDCTTESDRCNNSVPEKYIISKGDLIFSWSGTLLVDFWTGTKSILNQHLFKVTSSLYPRWFYYFWTEYHLEKFKNIAKGMATTLGHIKRTELEKSFVIVPDQKRLNTGTVLLEPIIDQILVLRIQNHKLKKLRDRLLPKLMNGEIEVPIEG